MQMNIWASYIKCEEKYEGRVDHRSLYTHNLSSCEIKAWKNSGLNEIWAHDFYSYDTGAVFYQLSYQTMIYEYHILSVKKDMKAELITTAYIHTTWAAVKLKPEKIQAWTIFEPMTSTTLVKCSTNWAIKPTESWSHC